MWISKEKQEAAIAEAIQKATEEAQTTITGLETQIGEMEANSPEELQSQLDTANEKVTTQATTISANATEITELKATVADLTEKVEATKLDNGGDEFKSDEKIEDVPLYS